ncbi:MAG TPA: hypothetical protein VEA78_03320 [Acidimicrobiales bacterium]|nr:hypothetical protein [Acidimicrobiales bacterium]
MAPPELVVTRPRIAIATCDRLPDGDPESASLGFEVVVWDDPTVDWAAYDLVVIRSTWDYTTKVDAFLAWVDEVPHLRNDADVVRWNHDKTYLRSLHAHGVPTVPTRWDPTELPPGRWVTKPTVSAGAVDTIAGDADEALAHVGALRASGRTAMVQPYLSGIDEAGETALLYLGGTYSHAVRKEAVLGHLRRGDGTYEPDRLAPRDPTVAELELAEHVLDRIPFDRRELLYARVDLIPDDDGDPVLLELELIEPDLFLAQDATGGAFDRFRSAITECSR